MDNHLARFKKVFVFIDDIVNITKRTKSEHMANVRGILNTLDLANLQVKAKNANLHKAKLSDLGIKLTNPGVLLINNKVYGITERLRPTNIKELRSHSAP